MEIEILKEPITREELGKFAEETFGDMVKVVADVKGGVLAIGAELHAEAETLLMEQEGSERENIWGFNIYPGKPREEWIEFDSLINIKPAQGNRSRDIKDENTKEKIISIVKQLVK